MYNSLTKGVCFLILFLTATAACKRKQEDILADINKHYKQINTKLNDYRVIKVDDIISKGTGNITGYYRDEEIKKIATEHFFDSCRTFREYYFDDGYLILILSHNYAYNRPQWYTEEKARSYGDSIWYDDKKTRLETNSFFFNQNHLIKWVDTGHEEVKPATAAFIDKESLLWAETKILLLQLKEQ